jgi:anti-sigma B factor antagonist
MKYSINKEERFCILTLEEDKLDTTLAPKLKSELVTLNAEGVKNLIMDLSKVKYTDSSGLSAILVGNRVFGDEDGLFVLASPTEHVMKLIKISQLDSVLNIVKTVDEAVDLALMYELERELEAGNEIEDREKAEDEGKEEEEK